jgi:putative heme-binding domain-containing protein
MSWLRTILAVAAAASVDGWYAAGRAGAQDHGITPAEIERGGQAFLAACATCHGPDGDAIAGVNLASGTFRRGTTDQDLIEVIQKGIPGTAMPPSNLSAAQAALVVAYLRSLPGTLTLLKTTGLRGDPANGKVIYDGKGKCGSCHLVNGSGGFLGPDLSSLGLTRRSVELERALTDPSADIRIGSRSATVTNKDGTTVVGRLLNQDTYSLQLIDNNGKLWSFQKASVRQWAIPDASAMPSYADQLTTQELADVVSYLTTLRAPPPAAGGGGGRGGPAGGRGGL